MNDDNIVELYHNRDELAIQKSMEQYGAYCRSVAGRILQDPADVEETVADTWAAAWNAMPPQRPKHLRLFLARITRNLALSRWRRNNAYRRGGGQTVLALEELSEVTGGTSPEQELNTRELGAAITAFLQTEPANRRAVFLRRYFYMEELSEIATRYDLTQNNVRMMLSRTRQKLKKFLQQEGYIL